MKIELKFRDSDARAYEYFLRKKFDSKASLKNLIRFLILSTVADEAQKESESANKKFYSEK